MDDRHIIQGPVVEPVHMTREEYTHALSETDLDIMLQPDECPDAKIMNIALATCSASVSACISLIVAKQWVVLSLFVLVAVASGLMVKVCWPKQPEANQLKKKLMDRIKRRSTPISG